MLIPVQCHACGSTFKVHSRHAGKEGTCPNTECSTRFRVPKLPTNAKTETKPESATPPAPEWMRKKSQPTPAKRTQSERPAKPRPTAKPRATQQRKPSPAPLPRHAPPVTGKAKSTKKRKKKAVWTPQRISLICGGSLAFLLLALVIVSLRPGGEADAVASGNPQPVAATPVAQVKRPAPTVGDFNEKVMPFLKKYCMDCHNADVENGGVVFHIYTDDASVVKGRPIWEKVIAQLENGAMPPDDSDDKPSNAEVKMVVDWLDDRLFNIDCQMVQDPGRVTIRRLNRAEYNNTIRDLVGVDFKPAEDFPSDDVGEGFDNNADVLTLPPLLLEKYLDAAETITQKAILTESPTDAKIVSKSGSELRSANNRISGEGYHGLSTTGGVTGEFRFPVKGEYKIRVEAFADQAGNELAKLDLRLNNKSVKVFEVQGYRERKTYETKLQASSGKAVLTAYFPNDFYDPNNRDRRRRDRNLYVKSITIEGPFGATPAKYPTTHTDILITSPTNGKSVRDSAREIYRNFAKKAYRRPITDDEIEGYIRLTERIVAEGASFEEAVQIGISAVLVSPHFLFRVEADKEPDNPEAARKLSDYELASRLSYFLWSSMPDDELFQLAEQGRLRDPNVLEQQVSRMLRDEKSQALVDNFASQWLNLRILDEMSPDTNRFRSFTPQLRADMIKETEQLFAYIMRENRSVQEFLSADYTFINQRLASHYNIENVRGNQFRKVSLQGTQRRGVLTHASILTLTSNPTRTSPVKRGKWVLENILASAPPDPPADVPDLEDTRKENPNLGLKEQLALHRTNATCASCHKTMDPIGLGFENFDVIGQWREKDGRMDIDPAGQLPTGDAFDGPLQLIQILEKREEAFSRALTEKLLIYSLGRGLEFYDRCAIDEIHEKTKAGDYRFASLITGVVTSQPFLMKRGDGGSE